MTRLKSWSELKRRQFAGAWNACVPAGDMGRMFGLSEAGVYAVRREFGLPDRVMPRGRAAVLRDAAINKFADHRRCLMCNETFRSDGPGNRICRGCKDTPAWREGQTDYSMVLPDGRKGEGR